MAILAEVRTPCGATCKDVLQGSSPGECFSHQ